MNYVITGSRNWPEGRKMQVWTTLDMMIEMPTAVIGVGDCPTGVDLFAREWLEAQKRPQQWEVFKADWGKHGKYAGPYRNREMVRKISPELVLAFFVPGEECRGTWDCVEQGQSIDARIEPFRMK